LNKYEFVLEDEWVALRRKHKAGFREFVVPFFLPAKIVFCLFVCAASTAVTPFFMTTARRGLFLQQVKQVSYMLFLNRLLAPPFCM